jgi:MFS transporter, DHA1 family, tetracycline resistance protein
MSGSGGKGVDVGRSPNSALGFVAAIVFLDMAGVGLIAPVLPGLIEQVSGRGLNAAALIGGALLFVYSFMLFLCAPVIGGLSDRYGRRPVLLVTLAAMSIDYFVMAWAPTLLWLFVGRTISGITGATWAAANSCIADLFPPEERGAKFGLLGGAGAAGFVLGPAIGGVLGEIGIRLPFVAAGALALAGVVLGWFVFPETLVAEKRRAFTFARANPLGTLRRMMRVPVVAGILAALLLFSLGSQATMTVWAFSLIERFGWSPLYIGLSVAVYGILLAATQGVLTGHAIARFGPVRTAAIGIIAAVPAFAILAIAPSGPVLYLGIVIGALGGLAFPAFQGLMSAKVDADAQGELQGAVASTISIAAVLGPLVMPPVFAAFSDKAGLYFPGAPFMLSALLAASGGIVFWRTASRFLKEERAA